MLETPKSEENKRKMWVNRVKCLINFARKHIFFGFKRVFMYMKM